MTDKIKTLGLILVCQYILYKSCNLLKSETGLFQLKTKRLINQLINLIYPILSNSISLKNIQEASKFLQKDIDLEIVADDISTQAQCIEMLVEILLKADANQVHQTHLILSNIFDNKKVFTENEINMIK